jgi:hypothetical protein
MGQHNNMLCVAYNLKDRHVGALFHKMATPLRELPPTAAMPTLTGFKKLPKHIGFIRNAFCMYF